jgi:oligoendopeptidase F
MFAKNIQADAGFLFLPTRDEIDEKYKWNFSRIFSTQDEFKSKRAVFLTKVENSGSICGTLLYATASQLKGCLDKHFRYRTEINKILLYSVMLVDVNPDDDALVQRRETLRMFETFAEKSMIFRLELLKLPAERLDKFFVEEPELESSRPYITNLIRRSSRALTFDSESILTMIGDNLWSEIDVSEIFFRHEDVLNHQKQIW